MQVLLATDIFGKTPEFDEMVDALTPLAAAIVVVDPYQGAAPDFSSEKEAYAYFQANVGSDRYAQIVIDAIAPIAGPLLLIGFSVGAAAVWEAAAVIEVRSDVKAFCFYGSQIRHRLDLDPAVAVEMFFPREESHFDVAALHRVMANRHRVTCHLTAYLHGFMNKRSKNYDRAGYDFFLRKIRHVMNSGIESG